MERASDSALLLKRHGVSTAINVWGWTWELLPLQISSAGVRYNIWGVDYYKETLEGWDTSRRW